MLWQAGDEIVWRSKWRGRTYAGIPVRVVRDAADETAVYLAEGTRFGFAEWPFEGAHPWESRGAWTGHGVLIQLRPGEAHSIWHFWTGPERRFACWYVNLQEPYVRDGMAFDSRDNELDVVIAPDGAWRWKDEELMEDWVRQGRFTREEVAAIRREGERVLAAWPFPTGWEEWEPDPAWPVPELPQDWARA
jgi:Protein of unknown function (DUF402)